jgi:hypothetical protein
MLLTTTGNRFMFTPTSRFSEAIFMSVDLDDRFFENGFWS